MLYIDGILGGLILGASSTGLIYFSGRITGISGITAGSIITRDNKDWTWSYLLGLLSAGALIKEFKPDAFGNSTGQVSPQWVAVAGLLVGMGTRLGSGCTSGHGICGLPRRSPRSLAAVLTFVTTGALTAYVTRETAIAEFIVANSTAANPDSFIMVLLPSAVVLGVGATLFNKTFFLHRMLFGDSANKPAASPGSPSCSIKDHITSYVAALSFGLGLGISGMCDTNRIVHFLNFTGAAGFDPSLMGVMGGGVLFNLATFHFMHTADHKPDGDLSVRKILKMDLAPENLLINWQLLLGASIFGVGWGLAGICPGPGIVSLGASVKIASVFVPCMAIGMYAQHIIFGDGSNSATTTSAKKSP